MGPTKSNAGGKSLRTGCKAWFGLIQWPGDTPDDAAHFLVMEMFWERWPRRHHQEGEKAVDVVWSLSNEVAVPLYHLWRLVEVPEHGSRVIRMNGMGFEDERRNNSEIAAAPPDCPEQILIAPFVSR